jgi:hypothetical protein
VDGKRSIGKIVAASAPGSQWQTTLKPARDFFERLWWWDQAVFNILRQAGG